MFITNDPRKQQINLEAHGYDFDDLNVEFFETAVIIPAKGGRWMAIDELRGRAVTVVFKRLGTEELSVISMRPASRKERSL